METNGIGRETYCGYCLSHMDEARVVGRTSLNHESTPPPSSRVDVPGGIHHNDRRVQRYVAERVWYEWVAVGISGQRVSCRDRPQGNRQGVVIESQPSDDRWAGDRQKLE